MKIAVIGTGYVGLVSGVCFSEFGFHVTCVDRDTAKISKLQQNVMPIFEAELENLVIKNRKAARLYFSTDLAKTVSESDVVLIAVGTPSGKDGLPDMAAVHTVAREVAKAIKNYTLVITKSTVPVGSNRAIAKIISETNREADFDVASNPEFLREGMAVKDFMTPDRVIAGVDSKRARDLITQLYAPVCQGGDAVPLFFTTFESAEMIKYAANSMLALRIAFINEIADLCESSGANIRDVSRGMGLDHRIGDRFLKPGPGYGGSCFPKDTLALKQTAQNLGSPSKLIEATIASNEARKSRMAQKITRAIGSVQGKTIGILGLAFKAGTDDMRDAASLAIIPALIQAGATIRAYDPQAMQEAKKLLQQPITWCDDANAAAQGADALVILTEWNEFRSLDFKQIRSALKTPLVIDLRNIFKRQDMQKLGFHYVSIGRQEVIPGEPWIADLNIDDEVAA